MNRAIMLFGQRKSAPDRPGSPSIVVTVAPLRGQHAPSRQPTRIAIANIHPIMLAMPPTSSTMNWPAQ
jgi:hypothetical protein